MAFSPFPGRITRSGLLPLLFAVLSMASGCGEKIDDHQDDSAAVARTTLVKAGQLAPDFTVELLGGGAFNLAEQRGQVVLVNFFATWCPPCRAEMPHLQTEVWEHFAGDGFAMVSIAREEQVPVVAPFVAERGLTWPFGVDPERQTFARFAEAYIPRNFVIDRLGRVVFESQGFAEADFAAMLAVIAAELGKPMPESTLP